MGNHSPHAKLRSERAPPPYFAGRAEQLAALNYRLDELCETGDPTSGMALIVGVPGVGKTQLARKFADEATRREGTRQVFWLELSTRTLKAEDLVVFMAMMKAVGSEQTGRRVADIHPRASRIGVGALSVRAEVTRDHVRHAQDLTSLLRDSLDDGGWKDRALLITIDELQTVDPVGIETLRTLHVGEHGCPVMVVGIGLQHTQQVLGNPADGSSGISRLAKPIKLESLPSAQALEAIGRNMQALGYEIAEPCVRALAKASHGFPQHIHGYLEGAIEAIGKYGSLDADGALAEALAAGDQARADYYDTRLAMLVDQDAMLPVIETMVETGRKSLRRSEAVRAVSEASFDGEDVVRQAIAHGVLSVGNEGVSFGIPSFHDHMEQRLDQYRRLQRRLQARRRDETLGNL